MPATTLEQLRSSAQLIDTLEHADIAAWVRPYLRPVASPLAWIPMVYWLLNALALALLVWLWFWSTKVQGMRGDRAFTWICQGTGLGFLILLPLHESCHALAYRLLGHREVRIEYHWRRLTALCTAPGAVVPTRQFYWVALAPSLILNPPLFMLVLVGDIYADYLPLLFGGALFMHIAAASGDFALVQYCWANRARPGLVTVDDPKEPRTYFFADQSK